MTTPSDVIDPGHGTPITSTPNTIFSTDRSISPSRTQISYRSEDDLNQSIEELSKKFHEQNHVELKHIKKEWNTSIKNWPTVVNDTNDYSSTETNSQENVNVQQVHNTVQKCLQTCDSILDKHSTLIL